jgi:hypothetical protein
MENVGYYADFRRGGRLRFFFSSITPASSRGCR